MPNPNDEIEGIIKFQENELIMHVLDIIMAPCC